MELKKFEAFVRQLQQELIQNSSAQLVEVYRLSKTQWVDSTNQPVKTEELQAFLNNTLSKKAHWRPSKATTAYFPLLKLSSIVVLKASTTPNHNTREKLQKFLLRVLKHSDDSFEAKHHSLTGLPNSRSVEEILRFLTTSKDGDHPTSEFEATPTVCFISIDIDHFKQINDSYGHAYGDIVLRCFASRLESKLKDLQMRKAQISFYPGQIGGEEFVVILHGILSTELVKEIAEDIRHCVMDDVLPNEDEWRLLPDNARPSTLTLPHIAERKITVSIGISSFQSTIDRSDASHLDLLREADAALYRAKSAGRNIVISFPDIRDKYGKLLEYHQDTEIAVIDIGSSVNVKQGNEFLVYHPDFSGNKAFMFSDGRSEKRLGTYPKMSCARLVVFNVQHEIAFCRFAELKATRIPNGCFLEYIPIGSIAHLVATDSPINLPQNANIATAKQLQQAVQDIEPSVQFVVIVFVIDDVDNLERSRGIAFINHALAGLFETLKKTYDDTCIVGQLQTDSLAVIVKQSDPDLDEIVDVIQRAQKLCDGVAHFGAGVFSSTPQNSVTGDKSSFNRKDALDYARYAALPTARAAESVVEIFKPETANRIVTAHRLARKFREGFADYEAFKKLGINYSLLENQAGFIKASTGDNEEAAAFIDRALALEPDKVLFKSNKAILCYRLGKYSEAYEIFKDLPPNGSPASAAYYFAMSAYELYKLDQNLIELPLLFKLLEVAVSKSTKDESKLILEDAIQQLKSSE